MNQRKPFNIMLSILEELPNIKPYDLDYDEDDEDSEVTNQQKLARYLGQFSAISTEAYVQDYYYDYPPVVLNGDVVVINIQGAIMQEDYCGTAGTKTIQGWYEYFNSKMVRL